MNTASPTVLPADIPAATLSALPAQERTLLDVLSERMLKTPDKPAYHKVGLDRQSGGLTAREVTYGEYERSIASAQARLKASGLSQGERVVLTLEDIDAFLVYFVACLGLGLIVVPLPSLTSMRVPETYRDRIMSVCPDCEPSAIVGEHKDAFMSLGLDAFVKTYIDVRDTSQTFSPEGPACLDADISAMAYLQYTSGSTGAPKGVVITHENLVANLRAIALGGHFTPKDISVFWLPLFHDMGLVGGPLLGLYLGFGPYLMTPTQFITRPHMWLESITKWRATFTVAPNFAYALAAYKIPDALLQDIDLSSLRLAFNGAEPINPKTVDDFLTRYEAYGFHRRALFPVYGLAEATLAVAFPKPGSDVKVDMVDRDSLARESHAAPGQPGDGSVGFVSVGRSVPEHILTIRDPESREPLQERFIGEVCVRGRSISPGYYGSETTPDRELATGDLGYLANGELYLVDRLKDLVIIAGENHAPSDIERIVGAIDGLRTGRIVAYGLHGDDGTEHVYVIAEIRPFELAPYDVLRTRVRQELRRRFSFEPSRIMLVPAGTLPRTSSGKLQRYKTKEMIASGALQVTDRYDSRAKVMVQGMLPKLLRALKKKG